MLVTLLPVGVCSLAALAFAIAGLRRLALAAGALERGLHIFEDRPVIAQFEALGLRFDKISADVATFPELLTRARIALERIQHSRASFEKAAEGVGFAARMARAVWHGPGAKAK